MLFPNAKRMNLKVSVSPISDLWKRVRMTLGHEFIGKKARPSRDSVLEFWSSKASCSERDSILCICLQDCVINLLVILKQKKGSICTTKGDSKKM